MNGVNRLELLRSALEATGAGNADALTGLYTDDFVLELPYYEDGLVLAGREALDFIYAAFDHVRFSVTITEVHPSADPDLVIVEYMSQGRYLEANVTYRNRYVAFWWFRDGQVCRIREFYNPAGTISHGAGAPHVQLVDEG